MPEDRLKLFNAIEKLENSSEIASIQIATQKFIEDSETKIEYKKKNAHAKSATFERS